MRSKTQNTEKKRNNSRLKGINEELLEPFTDKELMEELTRRGWEGGLGRE